MSDDGRDAVDERLEVLETKVGYQDRTIEVLNEVVTEQHDRIDELEAEIRRLKEAISSLGLEGVDAGEEPPPPHY